MHQRPVAHFFLPLVHDSIARAIRTFSSRVDVAFAMQRGGVGSHGEERVDREQECATFAKFPTVALLDGGQHNAMFEGSRACVAFFAALQARYRHQASYRWYVRLRPDLLFHSFTVTARTLSRQIFRDDKIAICSPELLDQPLERVDWRRPCAREGHDVGPPSWSFSIFRTGDLTVGRQRAHTVCALPALRRTPVAAGAPYGTAVV